MTSYTVTSRALGSLMVAATLALTSAAHAAAEPTPKPDPGTTSRLQDPSGTNSTSPGVITVADLPLAKTAKFKPVYGHENTEPVLSGISACSPQGRPVTDSLDPRITARSKVYSAPLVAAGDTQGWSAVLSVATYPSDGAASAAFTAYRSYLDTCPLADRTAVGLANAAGTSAIGPTTSHVSVATKDRWIEVFAATTRSGIVEVIYTKPRGVPVAFGQNPRSTFAALKATDIDTFSGTVIVDPSPRPR